MPPTIFVQIASYRDPQLRVTIEDCLAKASRPEHLRFGICWQKDESETLDVFLRDPRFRWVIVPYGASQGVCWARNRIQQLYQGEAYTLHLDSHHRFAEDWDGQCIAMIEALQADGFPKPLITTYAPSFDPWHDPAGRAREPWMISFDKFTEEGTISLRPSRMIRAAELTRPVRARFYSGHFAFTLGELCLEVPHDPELYFLGEETNITVRAFTHGYDLFHPHRIIVWHEYSREGRRKHWDDHGDWYVRDGRSHARNRVVLRLDPGRSAEAAGAFGFGHVRTLEDYERYAGISFRDRCVQRYTLDDGLPPNPEAALDAESWRRSLCQRQSCWVYLSEADLPRQDDYDFWYVGAHDADGRELFRQDISENEIAETISTRTCGKVLEFFSDRVPSSWTVWPHSRSRGWLEKISRPVVPS